MHRWRKYIALFLFSLTLGIAFYFLIEKYRMGMYRYVDMDEWAYLNWSAHMTQGALPYRDFLMQATPGLVTVLTPLFWIQSSPLFPLFGGRALAFVLFFLLSAVASLLFFFMKKRWTAVFVFFFLLFLPMPADKFLEIRPDTAATLFAMVGVIFQILWMQKRRMNKLWTLPFLAGLSYGVSFCFMQKTIFHIGVASLFVVVFGLQQSFVKRRFYITTLLRTVTPFFLGGALVLFLLLLWGIRTSNLDKSLYAMFILPREIGNMARVYAIPPLFYFHYIDFYYGIPGWNWGYVVNHAIWIIGLLVGIMRLLGSLFHIQKKDALVELFLAVLFTSQVYIFIFVMPFKHAQYLIPIAVFIVYYCVDTLDLLWNYANRSRIALVVYATVLIGILLLCLRGYHDVNDVKYTWSNGTNKWDLKSFQTITQVVPRSAHIFDMVGLTLYYPQPYYVSCSPVGQMAPYVSRPFPFLIPALEETETKYIYQGEAKRVHTLTSTDQEYIYTHYTPVLNDVLLVRNDEVEHFLLRLKAYETR